MRESDVAIEEDAVADVEAGASIVGGEIVGNGGEAGDAASVGLGEVERVEAAEGNAMEVADVEVGDELLLGEDAVGLELVVQRRGGDAIVGGVGLELVHAADVLVVDRESGVAEELLVDAEVPLARCRGRGSCRRWSEW